MTSLSCIRQINHYTKGLAYNGLTENAGQEIVGQSIREWKMQDWTLTETISGVENASFL